jgi:hypothetical protein
VQIGSSSALGTDPLLALVVKLRVIFWLLLSSALIDSCTTFPGLQEKFPAGRLIVPAGRIVLTKFEETSG